MKTGTTSATFRISGKTPLEKDLLIKTVINGTNSSENCFKSFVLIVDGPVDLEISSLEIMSVTSDSVTGLSTESMLHFRT